MTVKRRTFIKAAGFALAAPIAATRLLTPKSAAIDLMPFCDRDSGRRYDMSKPFIQGPPSDEWTYATDGRVCIRTKQSISSTWEKTKLPNAAGLEQWHHGGQWRPWPKQVRLEAYRDTDDVCPMCDGLGCFGDFKDIRECTDCYGDGWIYTRIDKYGDRCERCDCINGFRGGVKCDYCGGEGSTHRPSVLVLEDRIIGGGYARKVERLPGLEWRPTDSDLETAIALRFEGGEGLLMPRLQRPT